MEPFVKLGIFHQIAKPGSKLTNPNNLFVVTNDYWGLIIPPFSTLYNVVAE
jgi:hypothetical protein